MLKERRRLSRKAKKWIVIGTVLFVVVGGSLIYHFAQPKNALDFGVAKTYWTKEKKTTAAGVRVPWTVSSAVLVTDPLSGGRQVVDASAGSTSVFTFDVPEEGDYSFEVESYVNSSGINDTDYSLTLNGRVLANKVSVRTDWSNAVSTFEKDRNGNDVMPTQIKRSSFQKEYVRDYLNRTAYPLTFHLAAGKATLALTMTDGDLLLGDCALVSPMAALSYDDYLQAHPSIVPVGEAITLEAEKPFYKNDNSMVYEASKDVNCTPYDTYSLLLNVTSLSKCDYGQELTYSFEVPADGYYEIAANYSNSVANKATFVRLSIDGEIPFGEVANYPLYANGAYAMEAFGKALSGTAYKFYLTQGGHTLSFALDGAIYGGLCDELTSIMDSISAIYLQLRTLSVQSGDTSREWTPEEDFPGVVDSLASASQELKTIYAEVKARNGSSILNEGNVYLSNAYTSLDGLLKSPQYLPNNNSELAEGSGSIQNAIASASSFLLDGTLSLDRLVVAPYGDGSVFNTKSGFFRFSEGVKSFFGSFGKSVGSSSNDGLEVWVNRPTMYIDLMQNMVDSSFTKTTGIKVNFERLSDEGKLILSAAAGTTPDAVVGLSNWLPYELGIRNLSKNLRDFSDYNSVISRFAPGAMLPLVADDVGLGLPETQDFYVTYYRKDLFQNAGLSVPDTWQDVIDLLPTLQRKGMNYYIPLSSSTSSKSLMTTAPFIEQMGASLWVKNDDGSVVTGADSDQGLSAIKLMTNFYLLYGMSLQVNNFFDSFRNGSLPIGVSSMETYQKLQYAAPELAGKWDIALAPGIKDAQGTVERWEPGSATSCLAMKGSKEEETWSFLKWWDSAEVQSEFANSLRNIVGAEYIYIPANLKAFEALSLPLAHKDVIQKQWEFMAEYSRVPGWYMLERELSNCWNSIVLDGENARTAIDDSVSLINKEIQRKMIQFGYRKADGSFQKDYKFSTIEEIEGWQQSA
jgi:ABC-type glycerol-3-phosphate transport system substrate-binding protein